MSYKSFFVYKDCQIVVLTLWSLFWKNFMKRIGYRLAPQKTLWDFFSSVIGKSLPINLLHLKQMIFLTLPDYFTEKVDLSKLNPAVVSWCSNLDFLRIPCLFKSLSPSKLTEARRETSGCSNLPYQDSPCGRNQGVAELQESWRNLINMVESCEWLLISPGSFLGWQQWHHLTMEEKQSVPDLELCQAWLSFSGTWGHWDI